MAALTRALVSRIACGSAGALVALAAPNGVRADEPVQVAVASPPPQLAPPPLTPPPRPRLKAHRPPVAPAEEVDGEIEGEEPVEGEGGPPFKDYLRLHAGPLSIEPEVLMQVQGIPYVGADSSLEAGDPADGPGFRFRRARFGFEGRLFHRIRFELNAEYNAAIFKNPGLIPHDAWFGYDRYRYLQIFVGTMDVPFSRSALTGAGEGALIERPFAVQAMAPFHQLGARLEGRFFSGALTYAFGVYNGLERATSKSFFLGYLENPGFQGNRFQGLTYGGRITAEPLGSLGHTMEDLHHGKFKIAAGASGFYSNGGAAGVVGLGSDVLLHFRGLHVLGELLANRTSPTTQPTQPASQSAVVQSVGAVAEAGYVILKERLGVTVRFERIVPDTRTAGSVGDPGDSWIVTGGVSYHLLNDFLRAQLDYTHREELHGPLLKNDSVVIQAQLNL